MAYKLVESYNLGNKMTVYRPRPRTYEELTEFHADG
jgi:histone deacetylase 1/2